MAQAQIAAFRDWERFTGKRFADLQGVGQPTLVVHGIFDEMIPVSNAYWLSQHLPNAVLVTYPDAAHGCLFQFHEPFTRQAAAFLAFSQSVGNDLSTPVPAFGFPGLKPGDCWCLCAERWKEAFEAGKAPKVRLTGTHEATLEVVPLELLKRYAIDLS